MKPSNTKERLKYLMATRNLKQVDILKLAKPYSEKYGVKFNKSDISQYVTGRAEPNQDKLFVLGQALGVSEAWLMGFDVPMDSIKQTSNFEVAHIEIRPENLKYYRKQTEKLGNIHWTDEEFDKIIEYALFLVNQRKK